MITGRKNELNILRSVIKSDRSEFVAVYGRRRVGKTFLIREAFGYRFTFQHAGMADGDLKAQLFSFESSLKQCGYIFKKSPVNWQEAFEGLKEVINSSKDEKKIIFIDELSWMYTHKSDMLSALENFWNGFASARKDVALIVCASATSWMLSNVVHNKGGLYNRLTKQIHLTDFSLAECEEFTRNVGINLNREQILQYYMVVGGVPYYWELLEKGQSIQQNIDRILFAPNAPLRDEYKYLYASVFNRPESYIKIIESLGRKKVGMTREEIIESSGLTNSGDLTKKLDELESCGFIRKYYAFGMKKKNALYQLMDCFTLFYQQFLKNAPTDANYWSKQINTPKLNTWLGLAFERVCLMHVDQIKKRLGIVGVLTDVNSWYCKADPEKGIFGSQIDLLIVRGDKVINLCEMKYSGTEYTITGEFDADLRHKISDLVTVTGTKYAIWPTLVTTYGIVDNAYSGNIQNVVTMDDLFTEKF